MKKQNIFALIASIIWGTAFVAQSISAGSVAPFTYTMSRSLVATVALVVVSYIFIRTGKIDLPPKSDIRKLIVGGAICGFMLTVATCLQQTGLIITKAGKAGFITALYIVIVPILGLFFKKRVGLSVWISVAIAVVGLYFLCVSGDFSIEFNDILIILCAFGFAIHILIIDYFTRFVNGVLLSTVQFFFMTVFSGILMLFAERFDSSAVLNNWISILYVGVFSSAVAYTLQILAQTDSNPTLISLLLSLESVFSVIAGALILKDKMSSNEYIGCALMFFAVFLSQVPVSTIKKIFKRSYKSSK